MRVRRVVVFVPVAVLAAFIAFGSAELAGLLHQSPAGRPSVRPTVTVPASQLHLLPAYAPLTVTLTPTVTSRPVRTGRP